MIVAYKIIFHFKNIYILVLKECASAGNRTRIDCLEGNHANLYTTDAFILYTNSDTFFNQRKIVHVIIMVIKHTILLLDTSKIAA